KLVLDGLHQIDSVTIYGLQTIEGRTPVVLFNIDGINARQVMTNLDAEHNIAVRGGVHCAPLLHDAIGTHESGGVRVSPGSGTTKAHIELFLSAVATMTPQQVQS